MTTITIKNNATMNIPWHVTFDEGNFKLESHIPRVPLEGEMFIPMDDVRIEEDVLKCVVCSEAEVADAEAGMPSEYDIIGLRRIILKRI